MILNINATLLSVLRSYLTFAATIGGTLDDFLRNSIEARGLINEINLQQSQIADLTDRLEIANQTVIDTRVELEVAREEAAERPAPINPRIASLLVEALGLLGENVPSPHMEEVPVTPGYIPNVERVEPVGDVDGDTVIPHVEFETVETPPAPVADSIPSDEQEQEEEEPEDEEDFDLDDEDLRDEASEPQSVRPVNFTKHPDIIEDFSNLENNAMIMFVYVRYSHLPYHYEMNGNRYKFIINGSQVISAQQ